MRKRNSKFWGEFKKFISRGNVIDMAVGVIIATSFGAIVSSLVKDIFMPAIGALLGQMNLADLKFVLVAAKGENPEVAITYGILITKIIDFIIIAFVLFLILKIYSCLKRKKAVEGPPPPVDEKLIILKEIRDALKAKQDNDKIT